MVQIPKIVLPVVLGISLCSVSAVLLYILLKKDDDELDSKSDQTESSKFCTKEIPIPKGLVSAIIGRGGSMIKELEAKSGARINMSDQGQNTEERLCVVRGSQIAVTMAENLLEEIMQQQKSLETVVISVPHWATGRIIGRGGENINNICRSSGAKITINSANDNTGAVNQKRVVIIGNPLQIKIASDLIEKCVEDDKMRRETEGKNREPRGKHAQSNSEKAVVGTDPGTKGSCPQNAPPAGSSGALLEVFVSAVSSPSRFWLQIVGPQVEELDKLIDLMTEYYSNSDNRDVHKISDVLVGQMVAAVFRHDGKWYRAKVVEIKPNEFDSSLQVCDVHFVDYGDNEYVAKTELLSLRTDMLTLRYQAVECFLAGVAPAPSEETAESDHVRWDNQAIERFEELTQVARWKRLWSRTCMFKERPKAEATSDTISRNSREGSPIPGVKLYDTQEGKDIDIGQVLVNEGWAVEFENEPPKLFTTPLPTPVANIPPPSFGDLECSRVLGMVTGNREERATSLPHGGSSPSSSPRSDRTQSGDTSFQTMVDGGKPKSMSLAAGMDTNAENQPSNPSVPNPVAELSYPKPETNGTTQHMNGTSISTQANKIQNGDFLNAERGTSNSTVSQSPKKEETHKNLDVIHTRVHVSDPKDELKAKMNRVDSHHGSLETMGKQIPPISIISPGKSQTTNDSH